MKKIYLLFLALLVGNLFGQNPIYQWAKQFSTTGGGAQTGEIVTDNNGYVYVTGLLGGPMDFDPGAGVLNLSCSGLSGAYVGKYDPNGNLVWAFKIDGPNSDQGNGIAVDNAGNVFVTGYFSNTVDFDPGVGVANLSATQAIFVAKYAPNGTYLNAFTLANVGTGNGIAVDGSNNVVVTGSFGGTADFDPSTGIYNITDFGTVGGFVAKYSNSLAFIWADGFIGAGSVTPYEIEFDSLDKIYICGTFDNTEDMDPGAGTFNITTTNVKSIFFAKYNSNGTFRWAKQLTASSASGIQNAYDLSIDNNANVYLTGSINSYLTDFDPGLPIYNLTTTGTNGYASYLAKYDSVGVFIWAFAFGAANTTNEATNVDVDINNNPVIVGYFRTGTDFDPGPVTTTLSANGSFEAPFCSKYSPSGNYIWAFSLPPSPFAGSWPFMQCDISTNNYLHINGNFTQTVDFNPYGAPVYLFTSGSDIYVAKYDAGCTLAPSQPGIINGNNTICNGSINTYSVASIMGATSYSWSLPGGWTGTSSTNSINTTASSTSGNLTVTATNACGTSGAQTLSVTVNTIPSIPGTISGNISVCSGSANTYSIAAVAGATTYTWVIPGGWTGTSSTNIINTTVNSTSGNLTVTASNACGTSAAKVLSVTVNTNPTANAGSSQTITCISSNVNLNGSGVSTYTWNGPGIVSGGNSASPIVNMAGTYSLVGSTSGCNSNTSTVIVSTNTTVPSVSVTATSNSICIGNSATLTASGASTYSWSTSSTTTSIVVSPTTTTNYILTGTNSVNGCTNTINKSIGVNPLPTLTANTSNTIICGPPFQGTATITASGASTYTWNTTATTTAIAVSPSITTVYTVTGTDANGCINSTSFTQSVSACTGIDVATTSSSIGVMIYPNPTSGAVIIQASVGSQITIYNIIGELIFSAELKTDSAEINLNDHANGVYFIRVGSVTKKLIKQ